LEAHQGQPLPKGAVFYEINSFGFLIWVRSCGICLHMPDLFN
jgi:hypothetical protein